MIVPLDHAICDVRLEKRNLCVEFADGRLVCAPLDWFPLLDAARADLREEFEIAEDGLTVTWPRLGERVSSDFLLARRKSVAKSGG